MHVKQVSRGLAILLVLITAAYMIHTYPQFPEQVPMQWDGGNKPTWYGAKNEFFGYFSAGLLVMTCLFCFLIPRAATALLGVLLNLVALFAFHLVAAQVIPDPIFFLPVDQGTYIMLGALAVGMFIIVPIGIRADRQKPPPKEA